MIPSTDSYFVIPSAENFIAIPSAESCIAIPSIELSDQHQRKQEILVWRYIVIHPHRKLHCDSSAMHSSVEGITMQSSVERITMQSSVEGLTM